MKRKLVLPMIILSMGLLTLGCTVNQASSIPEKANIVETQEMQTETKAIALDNEYIKVDISIPLFTSNKNQKVLDQINSQLEKDALSIKDAIFEMSKENFEASKKDQFPFYIHEVIIDHNIHTLTNNFLSITALNYQFTGGAHGSSPQVAYNFDLTTGNQISLKDLFKENSFYEKVLNEEIQKQIQQEPENFFPDEVELFSGIKEDQSFYIEDNKLYIYFNQYDIAPYSSGIMTFEVPNNIIKDILFSPFIQ